MRVCDCCPNLQAFLRKSENNTRIALPFDLHPNPLFFPNVDNSANVVLVAQSTSFVCEHLSDSDLVREQSFRYQALSHGVKQNTCIQHDLLSEHYLTFTA